MDTRTRRERGGGLHRMLLRLPGVYRPQADSRLLIEAMGEAAIPVGPSVLDVGSGGAGRGDGARGGAAQRRRGDPDRPLGTVRSGPHTGTAAGKWFEGSRGRQAYRAVRPGHARPNRFSAASRPDRGRTATRG